MYLPDENRDEPVCSYASGSVVPARRGGEHNRNIVVIVQKKALRLAPAPRRAASEAGSHRGGGGGRYRHVEGNIAISTMTAITGLNTAIADRGGAGIANSSLCIHTSPIGRSVARSLGQSNVRFAIRKRFRSEKNVFVAYNATRSLVSRR